MQTKIEPEQAALEHAGQDSGLPREQDSEEAKTLGVLLRVV